MQHQLSIVNGTGVTPNQTLLFQIVLDVLVFKKKFNTLVVYLLITQAVILAMQIRNPGRADQAKCINNYW